MTCIGNPSPLHGAIGKNQPHELSTDTEPADIPGADTFVADNKTYKDDTASTEQGSDNMAYEGDQTEWRADSTNTTVVKDIDIEVSDNYGRVTTAALSTIQPDTQNNNRKQQLGKSEDRTCTDVSNNPEDAGWAWVVLLGSFFISMFVVGGQKSFGILYVELSTKFEVSNKALSSIQSLTGFWQQFLGPVSAALCRKYPHRTLIFAGGVLVGGGLMLSSVAPSAEVLYVTYGCITGIGYGLCFSPSVIIIPSYFKKYRSIASAMSLAGGGLGGMVLPYLIRYLMNTFGLQGAMLIYGAIMSNLCVCAMVIRPLQSYSKESSSKTSANEEQTNTGPCAFMGTGFNYLLTFVKELEWKLFRNSVFRMLLAVIFFAMFGYNSLFHIIPPFMEEIGLPVEDAAFLLFVFGAADLVGRIGFGILMDMFPERRHALFAGAILLFSIGIISTPFLETKTELSVLMGFYGVFAGGYNGTIMIMAVEKAGIKCLPSSWGFICLAASAAFLLNPIASGSIKDGTGSWAVALMFTGSMSLVAAFILIAMRLIERHERRLKIGEHNRMWWLGPVLLLTRTIDQESNYTTAALFPV